MITDFCMEGVQKGAEGRAMSAGEGVESEGLSEEGGVIWVRAWCAGSRRGMSTREDCGLVECRRGYRFWERVV